MPDEPQRNGPRQLDLWRAGSHSLNELVRVIPGFTTAEQGASLSWGAVSANLADQSVPVFADLGRIHTGSPSMPIAAAADVLIMVCRGDLGSVQHTIWRLEELAPAIAETNGRPPLVLPVVVTSHSSGDRHAGQIAELLGDSAVAPTLRGVGWIAWDPTGVAGLEEGSDPWTRPLSRSRLMHSASKVMWLLGMATGLDHATPQEVKRIRGRRTARDNPARRAWQPGERDPAGPSGTGAPPARASRQPTPGPPLGGATVEQQGRTQQPWQTVARNGEVG